MKRWFQRRLAKVLAGIVCAGLAATWALGAMLDRQEVAQRDKYEVARMTEKMKTVCIGRFLIDVPEDAVVELSGARIHGIDITAFDESTAEFEGRVRDREAQLKATPDRLGGNGNLELARGVTTDDGLIGKVFVHSRTVTEGTRAKGLELERYRYEGVAIEALVHANGVSIDMDADDYSPDRVENLARLVDQIVPNPGNQIPVEPGFCIDRGYFRDPIQAQQRERIMMTARLPSHPDIEFTLILMAGTKPDDKGLLERSSASNIGLSLAEKIRVTTLRAKQRTIGGLVGDELVERFVEDNESIVYSFWWEVNGTADDVLVPHLSFTMDTGKSSKGPVPSSLSEAAAIALWDKIASSIRLRRTESLKPLADETPLAAIGAYASAGDPCPQTGWWLCGDGGNGVGVLGGQRQFIMKGRPMPQALLLPPQTMWDRLRGLQPSFESTARTSWKLADRRLRKRTASILRLAPAVPGPGATASSTGGDHSTLDSARAMVGSHVATGEVCPASGWWRCEEPHALDGTRWFSRGNALPPATFAVPPSVFGRGSSVPKSIQRRGLWRLVRLADRPEQEQPGPQTS